MRIHLPAALIIALAQLSTAADYYVATTGNDSNPGTGISSPWKTISRAVAHTGLGAGDTVHVRGGTYAELVHLARSGTAGNPITLKAYAGESPIINGNGLYFETYPVIGGVLQVVGSHVVVDGLRVINATPGENAVGILVRGPGVSNVVVRNCSTDNTRSSGIAVWGRTSDYSGVTDVLIENNTITNAVNDGYQECLTIALGVDRFEVRGNTVRDSYNAPHPPNIPLGIDAKVNVRNGKIHHNRVHDLAYCSGIYVDGWDSTAYNIDIYNNIIHHVGHGGISIGAEEAGTVYNINVFDNLIYAVHDNGFSINHSNVATPPTLRDIRFFHNTVYGCGYYAAHITANTPNVVIANNIFSQNAWSNAVTAYSSNKANLTVVNNLTDGAQNAWLAGQEIIRGSGAISQAPRFVNASGADFHLVAGSPAIDAGTATYTTALDLDGLARPAGAASDLGAYEYGATSTNAAPSVTLTQPATGSTYTAPATITLSANAQDGDGSIAKVEFWNGGTKLGEDSNGADGWGYHWSAVPVGSYTVTARAFDNGNPSLSTTSTAIAVTVNAPIIQASYGNNGAPWQILADGTLRLEAENYDLGGEGIAYHDLDAGNNGGSYRGDAVDVFATGDAGGGHAVGWFSGGEWLEYSIEVPIAGTYEMSVRVARGMAGAGSVRVLANGTDLSGSLTVPETGNWDTWATVETGRFALNAGRQVLRIEGHEACNLNWIDIRGIGLPSGWSAADTGTVAATGSTNVSGDTWTVTGSGADIWGSSDAFHFASQSLTGNGTIVARVTSLQNTNPWAKAGVMIRETLANGSRHAFCCVTPGNGVAFQRRSAIGGASAHTAGSTAGAPRWVKLVRNGNLLTGYESANGSAWTTTGSVRLALSGAVYIGLAVTSHSDGTLAAATFDHVSVTPTASN